MEKNIYTQYSTGNYILYPMINHNGKGYTYMYNWITLLYSRQKLTQHCKSVLLQLIFFFKDIRLGTSQVVQQLGIACQCRGNGFNPWSGKIPHAMGQRSRSTTNMNSWSPWVLEPVLHNKRGPPPPQWEACTCHLKGGPCSLQPEKAGKQEWWLSTAKRK